jgi:hypothetical protein
MAIFGVERQAQKSRAGLLLRLLLIGELFWWNP